MIMMMWNSVEMLNEVAWTLGRSRNVSNRMSADLTVSKSAAFVRHDV